MTCFYCVVCGEPSSGDKTCSDECAWIRISGHDGPRPGAPLLTWEFDQVAARIANWAEGYGCEYVSHQALADRCNGCIRFRSTLIRFSGRTYAELIRDAYVKLANATPQAKERPALRLIRGGAA